MTYLSPTIATSDQALIFGANLQVDRKGKSFAELHPTRQYHQVTQGTRSIASHFDGEATSEVGLKAGMRTDFWVAVEPNTTEFERRARLADSLFATYMREKVLPVVQADPGKAEEISLAAIDLLDRTTAKVIEGYRDDSPALPVTIRVIISPMVTWIWIGAIIAIIGALFAAWPSGLFRRRKAT